MKITWRESKSARNVKKHGIDFEFARRVFDDIHQLSEQDRIEGCEYRWKTYGMIEGVLFMVGHDYQDNEDDECIHIITARKATPKERKRYHEG